MVTTRERSPHLTSGTAPVLLIMTELKMITRHLRMVEYARELGVAPVMVFCQAADTARLRELMADPGHPLAALAELWQVADLSVESVLAEVQDLVERYDVQGVISCGDRYAEPVAALAHLLGLPGSGWPAARISRNKLFQRYALPMYSPRWRVISPGARARAADLGASWTGPIVVKPTSRWGSSGVQELPSPEDLGAALAGYPAAETLLVEERVFGTEFSVESLVQGGELMWSGITRKETNEGLGVTFVEMAHTVPADGVTGERLAALTAANADVLRRLGFRDGIAHAEYRLAERGVVLMEVAFRVPGDGITALWGLATGRSMEEQIVDIAIGRKSSYPQPSRRVRHVFLEHPQGTLADVRCTGTAVSWTVRDARWPKLEPAGRDAPPRSCAVLVSKVPGDELGPIVTSDTRSASVLVDAPLGEDINRVAEHARRQIEIVVT